MVENGASKRGFISRLFSPKSKQTLSKPPSKTSSFSRTSTSSQTTASKSPVIKAKPLHTGAIYRPADDGRDEQTGERRDDTDLLHGLAHHDSHDSLDSLNALRIDEEWRPPGEQDVASLSPALWARISSFLSVGDMAALAFSTKALLDLVGADAWRELNQEQNRDEKLRFLMTQDSQLPGHLLCFACAIYHVRIQAGLETLKKSNVLNPVYHCPIVGHNGYIAPRARITPGWTLPFTFLQLAMRGQKYGSAYGISAADLGRRWKDPTSEWSHQSRFYIHKGHLLMRVVSKSFAAPKLPPAGLRNLLYSREDYTPYFSACAHWRDGELMNVCKCALSHIPENRPTVAQQLQKGPALHIQLRNPQAIVTLCSNCRPMRRCPSCPSEYLIELKLAEDKTDPLFRFKQAIIVTRWCDLGDGSSPDSEEWKAVNGLDVDGDGGVYDSFERMGKRAISGVFEAQNGISMPGQRMLSLNPKLEKLGEEGDGWY